MRINTIFLIITKKNYIFNCILYNIDNFFGRVQAGPSLHYPPCLTPLPFLSVTT